MYAYVQGINRDLNSKFFEENVCRNLYSDLFTYEHTNKHTRIYTKHQITKSWVKNTNDLIVRIYVPNKQNKKVDVDRPETCHPVVGTGISGGGGYCKRYCRGRGEVL